jgi:hypothetical protein
MQQTETAIAAGYDVFDADGEKLGTVAEIGRNYILVQKGKIFVEDIYVPLTAVTAIDAGAPNVAVDARKDEIGDLGWDVPPPYDPPVRARDDGNPDISIFRTAPLLGGEPGDPTDVRPETTLA